MKHARRILYFWRRYGKSTYYLVKDMLERGPISDRAKTLR